MLLLTIAMYLVLLLACFNSRTLRVTLSRSTLKEKKGSQCLRIIQRQVRDLRVRLAEFRPGLANEIADGVPDC